MRALILLCFTLFLFQAEAQQFITSGTIEFEVRTNVHRQMEGNDFFQRLKDQVPQFTTNYYNYSFAGNRSVYKFDRKGDTRNMPMFFGRGDDENIWYNDYTQKKFTNLITLEGYILMEGDQKPVRWKIDPDDQRVIAGFNCRKAQTILFDSVYVFVYYADEIKISGGPMGLHGLPGMILGVTVPRLFTSWVATGVKAVAPAATAIQIPTKGKKKSADEIKTDIEKLSKSWGGESRKWLDQMMWRTLI